MNNLLPPALVRQSLTGHSWIGLMVGVLMYLVCLSGTIAVFYEYTERWEQPGVPEYRDYQPSVVEDAFNRVLQGDVALTDHMYLTLPTGSIPRVSVATEEEGWFVNPDGSLGEATNHAWTHLLVNLHLYLHLPSSWGMILVSALGAMLCGLIGSGFLAHPRIFRDAFRFRFGGSKRLEQVDLHNRLSVWGAPFHLIIAVTGAWFGLVLLILALYANLTGSNQEDIIASVFGEEPQLEQEVEEVAVASALEQMAAIAPDATPLYMTLHGAGTPGQFMEIYGLHPRRLIYGESYRFDAAGNYLGRVGFLDGAPGKQVTYSIYRLHFGHFGGFWVKVLYGVLGLALTIVSVTGINIWLARRGRNDRLDHAWAGLVWGVPLALALSALTSVVLQLPSVGLFWVTIVLAVMYACWRSDARRARWQLQMAGAALIGLLLMAYLLHFGTAFFAPAALGINITWLGAAVALGLLARYHARIGREHK